MSSKFDFCGYATKNDLKCSDGRIIRRDAFKCNDGEVVPLVYNHSHDNIKNVLGHALLENREDGVYAKCTFNDTENGRTGKELVHNGDVKALSIYANGLVQHGANVVHGVIREVSLVLAGANPGATIDTVLEQAAMAHGDNEFDAGIFTNYEADFVMEHSAEEDKEDNVDNKSQKEELEDTKGKKQSESEDDEEDGETIEDVYNSMSKKQKDVCAYFVGKALEKKSGKKETEDDSEEGDEKMKHNVFDGGRKNNNFLSHADQEEILSLAKSSQVGTFQTALDYYAQENSLEHADVAAAGGFVQSGEGAVDLLFPEYKEVRPGAPELVTSDQGWISKVMEKVHKSPISRIRTSQVDIRNIDALRAKGYVKGTKKNLTGNFKLVRRTTDPQTVYVRNAIHRDDIIDITDFDYVQYLYNIDKMMLNEELATAIMLGDGREDGDADKIAPEHIRPIWTDDDLYVIHKDIDLAAAKKELQGSNTSANFGSNYIYAEAVIEAVLHAREDYKGSGTPDFYCTPALLNTMLLARDLNGRRIYDTKAELASALNVGEIFTAEQFANRERTTSDSKTKKLLGMVVNLADYSLGSTKGGEINHFTDFDIDFNQQKSLIETRCSGALTRVYSAIVLEEDTTTQSADSDSAVVG